MHAVTLFMEGLAKVLNLDRAVVGDMIEELQMSARIYQDENGRYLPL